MSLRPANGLTRVLPGQHDRQARRITQALGGVWAWRGPREDEQRQFAEFLAKLTQAIREKRAHLSYFAHTSHLWPVAATGLLRLHVEKSLSAWPGVPAIDPVGLVLWADEQRAGFAHLARAHDAAKRVGFHGAASVALVDACDHGVTEIGRVWRAQMIETIERAMNAT